MALQSTQRSARPIVLDRLSASTPVQLLQMSATSWPEVGYRVIENGDGRTVTIAGRRCAMFASNDYLGLRWDPRVIEASQRAAAEFGAGASSSRLVAGATTLHETLEHELALWLGRERALVFTTGYQANVGVLSAILGRHDVALCDRAVHASLIDGCLLSGARVRRFDRLNPETLRRRLEARAPGVGVVIITDGVYSMDGDTLPLDDIVEVLGDRDDTCLLLDEAHALGVHGPDGAGVAASSPVGTRVDLVTGNLSKSLASCGGYVAGASDAIDAIRATSRSLIFSTASPPASIAAALAALRIARQEPERRRHAAALAERLRAGLQDLGLDTGVSDSLIVPAIVGDEIRALDLNQALTERGFCVGFAVHPAVASNQAILRFSITAALQVQDVDDVLVALSDLLNLYRASS